MEPGEYGIIVTSGTVSDAARREAESFSDRTIRFIDGAEVASYLFEMLDGLPDETLRRFGIVRRPGIL
jgi:restriction endonuclease Mrr